jgi:hypothetical protein
MLDRRLRRVVDIANRAAFMKLGRPPEHGEWEHFLPLWAQEQMGVGPGVEPDLEEIERLLVPCGC